MTKYYTTRKEVDAALLPGQTAHFTTDKGYYVFGEPTSDGDPAWMSKGANPAAPLPQPPPPVVTDTIAPAPAEAPAPDTSPPPGSFTTNAPAPAAAAAGPIDWSAILGEYGMPADLAAALDQIFRTTGDINQAIPIAQAYVRGTDWYAQTYPGIQAGLNAGLFNDESGYRAYQNQVDQIYSQYYGRAATTAEITQYMSTGKAVTQVANTLQAKAAAGNISDPLKALFTPGEITAFSQEQAGIDTQLGQQISKQANLATQLAPLYQDFYGRAPTRAELNSLTATGTDAATVAKQFATTDNINAMDPAIRDLFTPAEIQEIALEQAGGTTQNGKGLLAQAQLATQLNGVYHQYTGAGVSRDEVSQAYQAGTSPTTVQEQLAGSAYVAANKGDIQQTAGAFGEGPLSDTQLQTLGEEKSGLDTPLGQQLQTQFTKALTRAHGVFQGVLAHPSLNQLANASKTPDVGA